MTMEVDTALAIINEQLVFAPGWKISAEPFTHRFESGIKVCVTYPACATERKEAPAGYPRLIEARADFVIVLHCDREETLLRQLLEEVIMPIQCHEAREMLRLKPSFWAPFHPHRNGGMERWGDKQSDVMFGLA
jgi:hypothetical protein